MIDRELYLPESWTGERPHPGAQLTFTDHDGWRFQAFATDTRVG